MKKILLSIGMIAVMATMSVASNVSAATSTSTATTTVKAVKKVSKLDQVSVKLQAKANKEIDRRLTALDKLLNKIQDMKKVSSANKTSFSTTVQGQVNLLNNLKTKIAADTDITTLKADVQSTTKAYRIYALILPQMEITAAADKLSSTTESVALYASKLQTRIAIAQASGKNVTDLQKLLNDMNSKITDANIQSAKAITGVVVLKPDNGVKTVMTANTTALKTARTAIKTGTQDLRDALKDAVKIRVGLKAFATSAATSTATSTATTTATTTSN